jgi:hypothetical protein
MEGISTMYPRKAGILALAPALLAAADANGTKQRMADFKTVPFGKAEKVACSPPSHDAPWQGIEIRVPSKVSWGAPLPVCGFVRVASDVPREPIRLDGRPHFSVHTNVAPSIS